MRIEFADEAWQDWDGPAKVMGQGLVGSEVTVETDGEFRQGRVIKVGWDEPEEAYGLLLEEEEYNTESFVAFDASMKVTYL